MPRTFDEYGALVESIPARGRLGSLNPFTLIDAWDHIDEPRFKGHRLGALADSVNIDDTVGGKIWQWLHPEALAAEYELTGRTAPDVTAGDVLDTAVARTIENARAAKESFVTGFRFAGYALAGLAVIYVVTRARRK